MSTVAILGCGYVGRALGRELLEAGHDVVGMCRSAAGVEAVADAGITPVQGDATDRTDLEAIGDVDVVVFAASSGGGDAAAARSVYVAGLGTVIDAFANRADPPERLVYTSSTGVYGEHEGDWVDEDTALRPATQKAAVLVEAEAVARDAGNRGLEPLVARLGGVYGPGRYRLERYLEGQVTEGWLNRMHVEDVAGALRFLLALDAGEAPGTVLLVDDEPAWKPAFAAWLAEQCGREPPETRSLAAAREGGSERRRRGQKRCSNARLRGLGYELRYPTYREGYRAAVTAAID